MKSSAKKAVRLTALSLGMFGIAGGTLYAAVSCGSASTGSSAQSGSSTANKVDSGYYKSNPNESVDIVALGDSVTAGYNTLEYSYSGKDVKYGTDNVSYADYVYSDIATANIAAGRPKPTWTDLAVSGQTTADLLATIKNPANEAALKKGDVFMLTISANDLLKHIRFLGIPYRLVASGLSGSDAGAQNFFTTIEGAASVKGNLDLFLNEDILQNAVNVDFSVLTAKSSQDAFKKSVTDMLSNLRQSMVALTALAPDAKIFFQGYQYPFSRLNHDYGGTVGVKNITSQTAQYIEFSLDGNFTTRNSDTNYNNYIDKSGVTNFKEAYEYLMGLVKDTVTSYPQVEYIDTQAYQDQFVSKIMADDKVTLDTALSYFQKDLVDIHPTEYSSALVGQKIFNDEIAANLGLSASTTDYADLKSVIANAKLPVTDAFNRIIKFMIGPNTDDRKLVGVVYSSLLGYMLEKKYISASGFNVEAATKDPIVGPVIALFATTSEPLTEERIVKALSDAAGQLLISDSPNATKLREALLKSGSVKAIDILESATFDGSRTEIQDGIQKYGLAFVDEQKSSLATSVSDFAKSNSAGGKSLAMLLKGEAATSADIDTPAEATAALSVFFGGDAWRTKVLNADLNAANDSFWPEGKTGDANIAIRNKIIVFALALRQAEVIRNAFPGLFPSFTGNATWDKVAQN